MPPSTPPSTPPSAAPPSAASCARSSAHSPRRRAVIGRTLSALLAAAALSACSSQELDVDGFAPGACTELSGSLQDIDATLRELDDDDVDPQVAAERFEAAQEDLQSAGGGSEGPVQTAVRELTTRLGFIRISVDTDRYDDELAADARTALDDLAQECRG